MSRPSHKPRNYHTQKIWQCKEKNWKLKTACKTKVTADVDIFTTSGMVTEKLCNLSKITSRQHTWMKEEDEWMNPKRIPIKLWPPKVRQWPEG